MLCDRHGGFSYISYSVSQKPHEVDTITIILQIRKVRFREGKQSAQFALLLIGGTDIPACLRAWVWTQPGSVPLAVMLSCSLCSFFCPICNFYSPAFKTWKLYWKSPCNYMFLPKLDWTGFFHGLDMPSDTTSKCFNKDSSSRGI